MTTKQTLRKLVGAISFVVIVIFLVTSAVNFSLYMTNNRAARTISNFLETSQPENLDRSTLMTFWGRFNIKHWSVNTQTAYGNVTDYMQFSTREAVVADMPAILSAMEFVQELLFLQADMFFVTARMMFFILIGAVLFAAAALTALKENDRSERGTKNTPVKLSGIDIDIPGGTIYEAGVLPVAGVHMVDEATAQMIKDKAAEAKEATIPKAPTEPEEVINEIEKETTTGGDAEAEA
jgi:hypothetical protein